jgi:hypothetical protein
MSHTKEGLETPRFVPIVGSVQQFPDLNTMARFCFSELWGSMMSLLGRFGPALAQLFSGVTALSNTPKK